MRNPVRRRAAEALPGLVGPARVERRTRALLPRLRPGDIAVLDHLDLDRSTAQSLVDADVSAVVNASRMISGRYPNLGPQVLAEAGITLLDDIGPAGLAAIGDGRQVRLHGHGVYVGEELVASGRAVDRSVIRDELSLAREGLATHLDSFTHNSAEFLRREQDVLLHGRGIPRPATPIAGRPVLVAATGPDHVEQLRSVGTFLREQRPVVIAVEGAAESLRAAGHPPDVIVVDGHTGASELPSARVLTAARDVVVRVERGGGREVIESLERIGVRPLRFESGATCEDAALIVADAGEPTVIVGVGLHATLDEFLDSQRDGLASTYLTRLKLGPRLVDASAAAHLYSGRVRPRHLLLVMLAGLLALAAAMGVTPVGQGWADQLWAQARDLAEALADVLVIDPQGPIR